MTFTIAPIVEGHGDVESIRILLGLIDPSVIVPRPVRFPKSKLMIREELKRAAFIARANIPDPSRGAIVVLFDADTDCAAEYGPKLQAWLNADLSNILTYVVIVVKEYESWICGGHPSLNLDSPDTASDPKGRIKAINGGNYKETIDQPRYTSGIVVDKLVARSKSFSRLQTFVSQLTAETQPDSSGSDSD